MNSSGGRARHIVYRLALGGLAMICLAALVGSFYTPQDPLQLDISQRLSPPSAEHWLGADQFGRDVFSRMLHGASVSLRVSAGVVLFATLLGVTLGVCAGYFGGWIDRVVSGVLDALLAMPGILFALVLIAVIGAGEGGVMIALGLAYAPSIARVVRGNVLSVRGHAYVEAARLFGHPHWFIMGRHILPNVVGPLTVLCTGYFAQALLSESVLSFLGLGVPPPYPTWGGILADGQAYLGDAPWLSIFPGAAITLSLLCINLTGDALRDRLDPRSAGL